jgi:hypothetical protein
VTPFANRRGVANLAYWVTGTEGSNPSLSANESRLCGLASRMSREPWNDHAGELALIISGKLALIISPLSSHF